MRPKALALICLTLSQRVWSAVASESRVPSAPIRQPAVQTVVPLGGQAGQTIVLELAGDFLDPKGTLLL